MSERQPNRPPIPEPQHTPHEGGKGVPRLPRTLHEQSKHPPLSEEFYQRLRERLRRFPQDSEPLEEERSDLARENEKFLEELRSVNPEGRERAQKQLLDYLFRRNPQEPKSE
jgi:hypothetical protein